MPKQGERRPERLAILHLKTDGKAVFKRVPHTLEALQQLVGGYLEPIGLQPVLAHRGLLGLIDEDAHMLGRAENPFSRSLLRGAYGEAREIAGNAVLVRQRGEEFTSLESDDEVLLQLLLQESGVQSQSRA